ncbi:MAG TPA: hypothetical protein PKW75_12620, partial [candidate division Zixibacteria bacterium]|nr:hypothetical protein [candidate division Zixibacteria bacterium]
DGYRWVRGGDRVLDASASARSAQRALPERAGPVGHLVPSDVHGKTPAEIDARAKQIGLVPRGKDPMHDRGAYVDPITNKERILSHPLDKRSGPHGHVNDPEGNRIGVNGNVVDAKSPDAHIPINWSGEK